MNLGLLLLFGGSPSTDFGSQIGEKFINCWLELLPNFLLFGLFFGFLDFCSVHNSFEDGEELLDGLFLLLWGEARRQERAGLWLDGALPLAVLFPDLKYK